MNQPKDPYSSCAFCRFMRSLAFSAIGAGVVGYSALYMGVSRENAIYAAFLGALAAVVLMTRKKQE
jgi:hypothetical protein